MATSTAPVRFHFLYPFSLPGRRQLRDMLRILIRKEKKTLESLDFIFCSDDYLLKINQDYLQHDAYTDIITFDMGDHNAGVLERITGEIYISVERVAENATAFKSSFLTELHRVMFHGVLHLCGYGDSTPAEKEKMRELESFYLKELSLKPPLAK